MSATAGWPFVGWNGPLANKPYVTVTPAGPLDGGDFGPSTGSSNTCGFIEAIAANRVVFVAPGTYTMPAGFVKIVLGANQNQRLIMAPGVNIVVPNGYAGFVFEVNDLTVGMTKAKIEGGIVYEAGSPSNLWTGLRLYSHSSNGVFYNVFRDMWFGTSSGSASVPAVGVQFDSDAANSFVNSNLFENIVVWNPITAGFLWNDTGGHHAFNNQTFTHCEVELGGHVGTTVGFKGVDGAGQLFLNCSVDNPSGSQKNATVASTASDTNFLGSINSNASNLTSSGTRTTIMRPLTAIQYAFAPSNPAGTASATEVMMGCGATSAIIPRSTGNFLVIISGRFSTSVGGDGWLGHGKYGSTATPNNGDAVSGTTIGNTPFQMDNYPNTGNVEQCIAGWISGLTIGTQYWIDISLERLTGGTATVAGVSITVLEV